MESKYLKYKQKYLEIKQTGGMETLLNFFRFTNPNFSTNKTDNNYKIYSKDDIDYYIDKNEFNNKDNNEYTIFEDELIIISELIFNNIIQKYSLNANDLYTKWTKLINQNQNYYYNNDFKNRYFTQFKINKIEIYLFLKKYFNIPFITIKRTKPIYINITELNKQTEIDKDIFQMLSPELQSLFIKKNENTYINTNMNSLIN